MANICTRGDTVNSISLQRVEPIQVVDLDTSIVEYPSGATTDEQILEMWVWGKAELTQKKYRQVTRDFFAWIQKPIRGVTLQNLQHYANWLTEEEEQSHNTVVGKMFILKSLFTFTTKLGYTRVNVGLPIAHLRFDDKLAGRILSEREVHQMINAEEDCRNQIILMFLYVTGCRCEELCNCKWEHLSERLDAGDVWFPKTKNNEPRTVFLSPSFWQTLMEYREWASDSPYIFSSKKRNLQLTPKAVWDVVSQAAKKAGIKKNVSPHWLRHSHVSHSLDRKVPIHVVKDTVGHKDLSTTGRYAHVKPLDSSARHLGV